MTPPNRQQRRARLPQQLAGNARQSESMPGLARVQQLSYSAQLSAVSSGCDCEACGWLREASDLMLAFTRDGGGSNAAGPNPPA